MKEKKTTVKKTPKPDLSKRINELEIICNDLVNELNRVKSRLGLWRGMKCF